MAKFAQLCAGERKVRRTDRWTEREKNKEEGADGAQAAAAGEGVGTGAVGGT